MKKEIEKEACKITYPLAYKKGFQQGILSNQKDVLSLLEEVIKKQKIIQCNPQNNLNIRVRALEIINILEELKQRIKSK